jgi:hypothetical protein
MIKRILFLIFVGLFIFLNNRVEFSRANFFDEEISTGNSVTAGCWSPPTVPVLPIPLGGAVGTSWDSDPTFRWLPSRLMCPGADPISYYFELYGDSGLTTLLAHSDWTTNSYPLPPPSLIDGTYYWRVKAMDSFGNESAFSAPAKFVLDRFSPGAPKLTVTGSWTKEISEKVVNGNFADGLNGWTTSGDVATVTHDDIRVSSSIPIYLVLNPSGSSQMARIGKSEYLGDTGNYVWENRLMQSIAGGAKNLAVKYDFYSRDWAPFDDPGFFIRINGREVFSLSAENVNPTSETDGTFRNTGWTNWVYDLTDFSDSDRINLAMYAGNRDGKTDQSWAYISSVTTYYVAAPAHATYHIIGSDPAPSSGITCEYKVDSGLWTIGNDFSIPASGSHTISARCTDAAFNVSPVYVMNVITDDQAPADISDLTVTSTSSNSAVLAWTAPGNDGVTNRATKYDVRYSKDLLTSANATLAAEFKNVPSPKNPGEPESLEISGLDPATKYYFAIRTADEAPNWSGFSNFPDGTTQSGPAINPGDLVINELMWMGTSTGSADEFLEIRNLTNREITLDGLKLTKLSGGVETDMIASGAFAGKKVPANGFFLITNYASESSALAVIPDLVTTSLELSNTTLEIKLYNNLDLIDQAGDGGVPFDGLRDGDKYYSMERTNVPGAGTDPLRWYTCIDEASHTTFFDAGLTSDERGTPGVENRSENEPLPSQPVIKEPKLELSVSEDKKVATLSAINLKGFSKLEYELTYNSDLSPEGVVGKIDLDKDQEVFEKTITLGTCSTGGTCVYHQGVKNFHLKVTLDEKKALEL